MPKWLIEQEVPGAAGLSALELRSLMTRPCEAGDAEAPHVHWVLSFVVDENVHSVYFAPDADTLLEHARRAGFPVNRIVQLGSGRM